MTDSGPKNWLGSLSDDDLVAHLAAEPERGQVALARVVESNRRLKYAVERLNRSTSALSWVMVGLAVVQVAVGILQIVLASCGRSPTP